jgi:hypothetical protein
MTIIDRLSSSLGHRNDVPNQALAKELVESGNKRDIEELVHNLSNKNKAIQSDCIKALYEIGYLKPELIASYVKEFCILIRGQNNRLVWGAMIALSTIASLEAPAIYKQLDWIMEAMEKGSVITLDNGVSVLANIAAANKTYEKKIMPYLLRHLQTCRPKEVAQHAERTLAAIHTGNRKAFEQVLMDRMDDISAPQKKRVQKILSGINIES